LSLSGRLIALLLAVSILAQVSLAAAGIADRAGGTFALMATDFVKAFEPMEGLVVQVEGDAVYLDIGQRRGAQVGQEFTIFRKGEPFRHPFSGKILGHYEDVLGYAQVKRVLPRFSEAVFIPAPGKTGPAPEDGARITRGRIRVAVTPVVDLTTTKADVRRIPYLVAIALERSKRFQVVDPLSVSDALASGLVRVEEVLARPERAATAAKTLDVSGWVVPTLLERAGVTYLDVTWISAVTATALFSRRQPLVPASTVEEQRFPWEPRAED
jgi:hypothetical protein